MTHLALDRFKSANESSRAYQKLDLPMFLALGSPDPRLQKKNLTNVTQFHSAQTISFLSHRTPVLERGIGWAVSLIEPLFECLVGRQH